GIREWNTLFYTAHELSNWRCAILSEGENLVVPAGPPCGNNRPPDAVRVFHRQFKKFARSHIVPLVCALCATTYCGSKGARTQRTPTRGTSKRLCRACSKVSPVGL